MPGEPFSAAAGRCHFLCSCKESNQRNTPPHREPPCFARRSPALLGPPRDGAGTRCAQTPAPLRPRRTCGARLAQGGPRSKATAAPSRSTPCVDAFAVDLALSVRLERAEHRRGPTYEARRLAAGGTFLLVTFLCVQRKVTPMNSEAPSARATRRTRDGLTSPAPGYCTGRYALPGACRNHPRGCAALRPYRRRSLSRCAAPGSVCARPRVRR